MKRVTVRYFAVLRDRAGRGDEIVTTSAETVRQVVDEIIQYRQLGLPSPLIRPALNGGFVDDQTLIQDGDELLLLPPVAGG